MNKMLETIGSLSSGSEDSLLLPFYRFFSIESSRASISALLDNLLQLCFFQNISSGEKEIEEN